MPIDRLITGKSNTGNNSQLPLLTWQTHD